MDAMTQIRGSESGTLVRHGLPSFTHTRTRDTRFMCSLVHGIRDACWGTRGTALVNARVNARCVSKRIVVPCRGELAATVMR